MEGKTKSGFEYKINEKVFSDWRFITAASKTQGATSSEQLAGAVKMVELVLGPEGYEDLMRFIAENNEGNVPAEAVMSEVTEIINAFRDSKN